MPLQETILHHAKLITLETTPLKLVQKGQESWWKRATKSKHDRIYADIVYC